MEFKKKTQIKMGIYYKETSFIMTAKQLLSAGKCVLLFIFVI